MEGLSQEEARERLARFGRNVLREEKISKAKILLRQFKNLLVYILLAASLISLSIGEWPDFLVIVVILIANGLIGFWQEAKAETSLAALKKLTESRSKVVRGGVMVFVSSSELVPGDYLILHEGEVVAADVQLIESAGLMVDEASLTGESGPVVKDHNDMLLTGTTVVRGTGRGVVMATGSDTYFAKIAEKAIEASPETPLTKALRFFTKRYVAALFALFVFLGIVGHVQGRSLLDLAYILLASLVSAVPEGLPIVTTLVLVIGAVALSKRQTLIRYLPSVETLGSATVIASDKTGTITEGKLVVKEVYTSDLEKLQHIAALCNDSHEGAGDPMDVALADWVDEFEEIRRLYPRKWAYSFDTRLMLMATLHKLDGGEELLVKGAYEALKEKAENPEEMEAAFHAFLEQGLRVVAFGVAQADQKDPALWKVRLVGLVGFLDPPKEGVAKAVAAAKKAGVRVVMITGDHPKTARAVAKEVGIWAEGDRILMGKEIETLSDEKLLEEIRHTTVFARILPEHKYRLVKLLQKCDEIVAVTGDGVNDVPALKAADIGIAMGSGTEAAKNASKMVITDNNLKVIIEAIKNARVIADNIRKVIYYLLATSLQEIILIVLAIFSSLSIPLAAIQILWINIVSDGVQDKTFPFAKAEGDVMRRKPRRPEEQFFDLAQIGRILVFGIAVGLLCFFLYVYLLEKYPFAEVSTIMFVSVVVAQWANGIQAQKEKEPFLKNIRRSFTINPWIFLGLGVGILLQYFAIYAVPRIFHSIPLSWEQWKYPALVFLASFAVVEIRKWVEIAINGSRGSHTARG